jgi:hypothetical protein
MTPDVAAEVRRRQQAKCDRACGYDRVWERPEAGRKPQSHPPRSAPGSLPGVSAIRRARAGALLEELIDEAGGYGYLDEVRTWFQDASWSENNVDQAIDDLATAEQVVVRHVSRGQLVVQAIVS